MSASPLLCSCLATLSPSTLPTVGLQADGAGGVIRLFNCPSCGSTRSIEAPGRSDDDGHILDACRLCKIVDALVSPDGRCAACAHPVLTPGNLATLRALGEASCEDMHVHVDGVSHYAPLTALGLVGNDWCGKCDAGEAVWLTDAGIALLGLAECVECEALFDPREDGHHYGTCSGDCAEKFADDGPVMRAEARAL